MCLAVPGEVIGIGGGEGLERRARVRFGGTVKEVSLAFTPEARPGDYVLVHAGLALSVLSPDEAGELLREFEALGHAP